MRIRGFRWETDTVVQVGEDSYDLHDSFVLRSLAHDLAKRSVMLQWVRANEDLLAADLPSRIVLVCDGLKSFEVRPRDPDQPFSEDECFAGLGYLVDEDWCTEPFWSDDAPLEHWKWVFEFISGWEVIIDAETASMSIR